MGVVWPLEMLNGCLHNRWIIVKSPRTDLLDVQRVVTHLFKSYEAIGTKNQNIREITIVSHEETY